MELGLFLFLTSVGVVGFIRRSLMFTGIAVAVFFIIAIVLSTGTAITQGQSTNSTMTIKNATGATTETRTTNSTDNTPIISENLLTVSYIFYAAGIAATILFVRSCIGFAGWM